MEMGRRWAPHSFPRTSWSIHRWFWRPSLGPAWLLQYAILPARHDLSRVRGGRRINYVCRHTAAGPGSSLAVRDRGAGLADWTAEMPAHYQTASRMLGVTENKILGAADHLLKYTADATGCGHTFYRTRVGILQAPNGEAVNHASCRSILRRRRAGRGTCSGCGGCMMGCRYGAKNTLDLNYLYLAEKNGARIFPETKVVDVRPLSGRRRWRLRVRGRDSSGRRVGFGDTREIFLPRRGLLRVGARHHGTAFPAEARTDRLPALSRDSGQACAHQLGIDYWGASAECADDLVAGHRDWLRDLH